MRLGEQAKVLKDEIRRLVSQYIIHRTAALFCYHINQLGKLVSRTIVCPG